MVATSVQKGEWYNKVLLNPPQKLNFGSRTGYLSPITNSIETIHLLVILRTDVSFPSKDLLLHSANTIFISHFLVLKLRRISLFLDSRIKICVNLQKNSSCCLIKIWIYTLEFVSELLFLYDVMSAAIKALVQRGENHSVMNKMKSTWAKQIEVIKEPPVSASLRNLLLCYPGKFLLNVSIVVSQLKVVVLYLLFIFLQCFALQYFS